MDTLQIVLLAAAVIVGIAYYVRRQGRLRRQRDQRNSSRMR